MRQVSSLVNCPGVRLIGQLYTKESWEWRVLAAQHSVQASTSSHRALGVRAHSPQHIKQRERGLPGTSSIRVYCRKKIKTFYCASSLFNNHD